MSNADSEPAQAVGNIEAISSIAEAARERRVSERTIYRMLKSGKLRRVKNVTSSVTFLTEDTVNEAIQQLIQQKFDEMSVKMSDTLSKELLRQAGASLRNRDEMMEALFAREQELVASNQRLQEQIAQILQLMTAHMLADKTVREEDNKLTLSERLRHFLTGK